jgi:sec-independent protein translocase protein TatC
VSGAPAPALPAPAAPEKETKLSLIEHLRELRKRLVRSLQGLVIGCVLVGAWVEEILHWLMGPVLASLPEGQRTIQYTSYVEPLMVYLKLALYGGVFAAAPWILYQLWLFIAPGLYKRERKVVVPFVVTGTALFYGGAAFCYFLVMPAAFPAMAALASDSMLRPMLTMSETLSLVLAMLLGFGLVFELPVVIAFLAMIGLVSAETLAKHRRLAIVINVTVAAIITPTGDPLNLALMAVPMILFYEVGVLAARILGKKKDAPAAEGA